MAHMCGSAMARQKRAQRRINAIGRSRSGRGQHGSCRPFAMRQSTACKSAAANAKPKRRLGPRFGCLDLVIHRVIADLMVRHLAVPNPTKASANSVINSAQVIDLLANTICVKSATQLICQVPPRRRPTRCRQACQDQTGKHLKSLENLELGSRHSPVRPSRPQHQQCYLPRAWALSCGSRARILVQFPPSVATIFAPRPFRSIHSSPPRQRFVPVSIASKRKTCRIGAPCAPAVSNRPHRPRFTPDLQLF